MLVLAGANAAVAIDPKTEKQVVGSWTFDGGRIAVSVAGFTNTEFSFFGKNGVAVRLFDINTTEGILILGYEDEDAFDATIDCVAVDFAGLSDLVLTLDSLGGVDFFTLEDLGHGTGVDNLVETRRFGGYYVEGERVFVGIDFQEDAFLQTDSAETTLLFRSEGSIGHRTLHLV